MFLWNAVLSILRDEEREMQEAVRSSSVLSIVADTAHTLSFLRIERVRENALAEKKSVTSYTTGCLC